VFALKFEAAAPVLLEVRLKRKEVHVGEEEEDQM
jgi:hypothetical protein